MNRSLSTLSFPRSTLAAALAALLSLACGGPSSSSSLGPNGADVPPILALVDPGHLPEAGGTIILHGEGFAEGARVLVGADAAGSVQRLDARQLVAVAPPQAAGTVDVTVENPDGQRSTLAAALQFDPPAAPPPPPPPPPTPPPPGTVSPLAVASVSPASGPEAGGTAVTISGSGFVTGTTATFGGQAAFVTGVTPTALTVLTPPGLSGPADVTVTNPDREAATLASAYTYVAPPSVVSAINRHGSPQAGGDLLLLAGSGLEDAALVTFGGAPSTGLAYDPLRRAITVVIPPCPLGPTADAFVDLVVVNLDGQSTTVPGFHYGNPPAPSGFTPDLGQKGDTVTITGVDFTADTTGPRAGLQVAFGGTLAVIVDKSPTQITVVVPKMNPGVYQLVVTNFDGQYAVPAGSFTLPGP